MICCDYSDSNPYQQGHQSAYTERDAKTRQDQARVWETVTGRRRAIACISSCLFPATCPIWTIQYLCCCWLSCLNNHDDDPTWKTRWMLSCCYPQNSSFDGGTGCREDCSCCCSNGWKEKECGPCCSSCCGYTDMFCSVLYPFHACPSIGVPNHKPTSYPRLTTYPWGKPEDYAFLAPERQLMQLKVMTKSVTESQQKRRDVEQLQRIEQERQERERRSAQEAADRELERDNPLLASAYRQERLLIEQNRIQTEKNWLLENQNKIMSHAFG